MANPNNQAFFAPAPGPAPDNDLLGALTNTLATVIDQRVNQIVDLRFNDIEQRLAAIEAVMRAEGRLSIAPPPPAPRQSPLRSQQQQQVHQQHQQQPQQTPQQQHHAHQQQHHAHQHQLLNHAHAHNHPHATHQNTNQHSQQSTPVQQQQHLHHQQQQQFQPNPTANQQQAQNGAIDPAVVDPVMALASVNNTATLGVGGPGGMQQQQQQNQQQNQQLPPPPPAPVVNTLATLIPMEIPPEGYPISSRATMQLELDQFTIPRGYSMRMSGTRDMGKGKRKIRWICFRAGEARYSEASKAAGMPERASKKCNCPFKFECVETFRDSNMWVVHHHITPGTTTHNHPPSDPSEDPRSRKLPPQVAAEVDAWLRSGWQVSKIMTELKNRGFKNVLSRDLYNRRQQLKREDEGGSA